MIVSRPYANDPSLAIAKIASSGLFVERFEDSSILRFPIIKSIRAATLNHCCGRARARKLYISCKPIEAVHLDEATIVDQLVPKSDDIWPFLRRLALLQYSRGIPKHDEAIWRAVTASFGALHATEKSAAGLLLRRGLPNWDEKIGSEHRQQLSDAGKEHIHIFPIGLWKLRDPPAWFCSSVNLPTWVASLRSLLSRYFTWALVRFSSLLNEHDSRNPKVLGLVLFEAIANNLRLADVGARQARLRIGAG